MINNRALLFTALIVFLSNTSVAADSSDVEKCTQEKKDKITNIYGRCFPIAAICWGWGAGEDAVYEYCNVDKIKARVNKIGASTDPSDMDAKKDWDCGGSKSSC